MQLTDTEFGRQLVAERLFLIRYSRHKFYLSVTDAEDLVQEVMLRAWEHRDTYISSGNMRAWLVIILVRYKIICLRKDKRFAQYIEEWDVHSSCGGSQDASVEIGDVVSALAKMPRHQQDAIVNYARGYTYAERMPMERANCRITLRTRTVRTLKKLRRELESLEQAV